MSFTAAGPLSRQWLAVACSADVQDSPLAVRLLGNDLVLWRSPSGAVVAAPDRCTHSKRALSKGTVDHGRLACPKHGWTFGDQGRCVFKPSGLPITDNAHLKTYPTTERYGLIWMSIGEPDAPVVDLPWDGDEGYRRIHTAQSVWRSNPIHIVDAILAGDHSPSGPSSEVTVDLPFNVHSVVKSGAAEHRRLVSCAPLDGRGACVVTTVVWTTSPAGGDDAAIVTEVTADLDAVRSAAEESTAASPVAETSPDDENTASSEWKRRLSTLVAQGS